MVYTTPNGSYFLTVGIWAASIGALYGIVSLSYYGLGLSDQPSAWRNIKRRTWPLPAKMRIQKMYKHLFFSFYICITAAIFVFSHPYLLEIFSSLSFVILDIIVESVVQKGKIFTVLDSEGTFSNQRIAWVSYCALVGSLSATYLLNGIQTVHKSVRITFVCMVGLTALSLTAPITLYYDWMGAIHIMQDIVSFASIGAALIPLEYTIGVFFFSLSLYGGLIAYPLNFLTHAQEAHVKAVDHHAARHYCPPALSTPMFLSIISFFTRIVLLFIDPEEYRIKNRFY